MWIILASHPALAAPKPERAAPSSTQPSADPAAPTAGERQARLLFQNGLDAFAAQRYSDALAHFSASYRLVEKNVVLFNIAMCHRALFEYTQAIATFGDYLKRRGTRLPLPKRREVERVIQEMQGKLGQLRLTVDPDGSEVLLDGQPVGRTPLATPLTLDPGQRVVALSHPERLPKTLRITVGEGQTLSQTVRLATAPREGRLVLRCNVPRCRVRVGEEAPEDLPATLSLPPGSHRLRVEAPFHMAQWLTVQVAAGDLVRREVLLLTDAGGPGDGGGRPTPLVRRWWFWTALSAGLLAVVGTTTGLVFWDQSRSRAQADHTWRLP